MFMSNKQQRHTSHWRWRQQGGGGLVPSQEGPEVGHQCHVELPPVQGDQGEEAKQKLGLLQALSYKNFTGTHVEHLRRFYKADFEAEGEENCDRNVQPFMSSFVTKNRAKKWPKERCLVSF